MEITVERDDLLLWLNDYKTSKETFGTQSIVARGYCEGHDGILEAAVKQGLFVAGRDEITTEE